MRISYDYDEFIQEIHEELADGVLALDDEIQILRGPSIGGYSPIVDWYYDHETMTSDYIDEHIDPSGDLLKVDAAWRQYNDDRPHLETMKVSDVLAEMMDRNRIL